jgi:hypothetical protein
MTKLSLKKHKNPIKVKKQQLCDRINKCKSLKELKEWERVFSFHPVLKDDQDWDYGFFLDLIEFKLKRMREYFWTHNIVVDESKYGDVCNKLINILSAGYKTDIIIKSDLHNYVNTKNANRFFSPKRLEFIQRKSLEEYYLPAVREEKAKRLFWKYLEWHIEELWD